MGVLDGADSVNRDTKRTVCAVLETDGETETTGELTVKLALGGTRTDGTDREHIGKELRRNSIENLGGDGHTLASQVNEELTSKTQTLVDVEATIDIRVVDQTLPANSSTRLLEVRPHDDEELILVLLLCFQEQVTVLECGLGVVDGARTDDD
jgi:hypothetical protein